MGRKLNYIRLLKHTRLRYFGRRFLSFMSLRYVSFTLRYVTDLALIQFQGRFQIKAFSMKVVSVLVWTEGPKRFEM